MVVSASSERKQHLEAHLSAEQRSFRSRLTARGPDNPCLETEHQYEWIKPDRLLKRGHVSDCYCSEINAINKHITPSHLFNGAGH